ncbi:MULTISPECIES: hypothetical protein [unclassified Nostoc]|nr:MULTISPECIES: hypothetical protein [unclassified Nostoc]MDZ8124173.1 hypothetical protein [Nostoc sp. CmiVER01]MDZ8224798.1 hypothetical protein [Nostoc sp. ChiVER01]
MEVPNEKNSALADFCGGDRAQQIKITKRDCIVEEYQLAIAIF